MIRPIALAAVLALAAVPAASQSPPPIRLTSEPMAAAAPALKYYLVPQVRDCGRGNAALLYYRSFSPEWQAHRRDPKYMDKVYDSIHKPLRDLTRAEVDDQAGRFYAKMLQEVDRGARRTYCDWELNERMREEGIALLLPDVQGFRQVGILLKLRARKELLDGRYDQAARTLQTGLTLARHIAEGPTLIHSLVGLSIASMMLTVVDDWIERPGAPNLYWALTDLPRPLISVRNGLEGERLTIDSLFPGYRELLDDPGAPQSPARVQTIQQQVAAVMDLNGAAKILEPLFSALKTYPRAKRFLRQRGRSAAEIEAMPALQAVFLYEIHQYDVAYDDMRKAASLPYHEAAPFLRRVEEQLKTARSKQEAGSTLATLLLPALNKVLSTVVRTDRKAAALRCLEALRLHAAAHGGKLPAKLDDVTEAPIPLDPYTDKPFEYRVEKEKAVLTGPAPAGEPANVNNFLSYELTIRTMKGK